MMQLWSSIIGPKLFRIYTFRQGLNEAGNDAIYKPNVGEKFGSNLLQVMNVCWNVGVYTSPIIIMYLYKRDYFCLLGCISLGRFATGIGILLIIGMVIRGIGRNWNPVYTKFLNTWTQACDNYTTSSKNALSKYDFDFSCHPIDFKVTDVAKLRGTKSFQLSSQGKLGFLSEIVSFPCYVMAYLLIHLFGRHLIYPGSIHLLQFIMEKPLHNGREILVTKYKGHRNKVLTRDGNEIDTMFVDRRKSERHSYGSTLVVCCEGNAGFYEVGLMSVPLQVGYSVLGWNHPGFAGSTGKPFPEQDQNAIDAVMQFSINQLKFLPENILIFAWSIGGYTGTWAAMQYPTVRGVILDATFDDVLPLAVPRMPTWMSGLVKLAIRNFMNLNTAEQLCEYPGPVTIIRRTKDEIITTVEGDLSTNRGNNLFLKLMKHRYPKLMSGNESSEVLRQWVSEDSAMQESMYRSYGIEEAMCFTQLTSYIEEFGENYPLNIGEDWTEQQRIEILLFIAKKMFVNFDSGHNNMLDSALFKVPWSPNGDFEQL